MPGMDKRLGDQYAELFQVAENFFPAASTLMMNLAYTTFSADNGTHMWADTRKTGDPLPGIICEACGMRRDWNAVNPKYKPPRSYYDVSRCFDGDYLISPKLREYLESQNLPGLRFVPLPSSERFYILQTELVLKLEKSPKIRMEEFCGVCNQYKSVWGTDEIRLMDIHSPVPKGIYFTDLRIGYYPQMGPKLIVGIETWEGMVAQRFKGLGGGKPITH